MSCIRAATLNPDRGPDESMDLRVHRDSAQLDMNLDDEILQFVLDVISKIDQLGEGQALVIWKEIF